MRTIIPGLFIVLLSTSVAFSQEVGDTVVVILDQTPLMIKNTVITRVESSLFLHVEAVNGQWLWVSNEETGWVNKRHVTTIALATTLNSERIRCNPQAWCGYYGRGNLLYCRGEFDRAISDYEQAICLNPCYAGSYCGRGMCRVQNREFEQAIADFNEAIRLEPGRANLYNNRACCWIELSAFDKAIADGTVALRCVPRCGTAYCTRGIAWQYKADYDKAIADFSAAAKIDPMCADHICRRAQCWIEKGEYEKAIVDLNQAIVISPKDADCRRWRGWYWCLQYDYDHAIADYSEAIKNDPKDAYSFDQIAWIYATNPDEKYRNGEKAIEYAKKACEMSDWKDSDRISTLAAAFADAGDYDNAIEWQVKAIADAPEQKKVEYQSRLDLYKSGKPYRIEPNQ